MALKWSRCPRPATHDPSWHDIVDLPLRSHFLCHRHYHFSYAAAYGVFSDIRRHLAYITLQQHTSCSISKPGASGLAFIF